MVHLKKSMGQGTDRDRKPRGRMMKCETTCRINAELSRDII